MLWSNFFKQIIYSDLCWGSCTILAIPTSPYPPIPLQKQDGVPVCRKHIIFYVLSTVNWVRNRNRKRNHHRKCRLWLRYTDENDDCNIFKDSG